MKIKPYLLIARNRLLACLAYRGHFFLILVGTIIYLVVGWFLWQSIYANGGTIRGLSFTQAYLYVGISMGLFTLIRTEVDWRMHNMVKSGDLLRFLTKPIDFTLQFFMESLGQGAVNGIMIAAPSFLLVFILTGAGNLSFIKVLLFSLSVALGFLINFFIDFLTGLSVFLTLSISGISNVKDTIVTFLSGAIIPLFFFPPDVRAVLEWLPFQALYHTPVRILMDNTLDSADILFFFIRQVFWLIIFYGLVRLLFSAGIKKLVVNGG